MAVDLKRKNLSLEVSDIKGIRIVMFCVEMDIAGHPLKIYNQSLVEGKYMAQINEVAQKRLRREIIELIKESVPEWKETNDERILVKAEEKYRKYEKVVIDSLLDDPEQVPIYDIENI